MENHPIQSKIPPTMPRRSFLALAWKTLLGLSSALGLAGLCRYFSYQPNPAPPTRFDLGPVDRLPINSNIDVKEAQAILIPEETGYQAYSLVCPHLGCLVEHREAGFLCPCHGSEFYPDGSVKKGPATAPLTQLKLEVDQNEHLILDTDI